MARLCGEVYLQVDGADVRVNTGALVSVVALKYDNFSIFKRIAT